MDVKPTDKEYLPSEKEKVARKFTMNKYHPSQDAVTVLKPVKKENQQPKNAIQSSHHSKPSK